MNANIHCANMDTDYYFVQPQFGKNELEWSKNQDGQIVIKAYGGRFDVLVVKL